MFKPGDMVINVSDSPFMLRYKFPAKVLKVYKNGNRVIFEQEHIHVDVPTSYLSHNNKRLIGNIMILDKRNNSTRMITPSGRVY